MAIGYVMNPIDEYAKVEETFDNENDNTYDND